MSATLNKKEIMHYVIMILIMAVFYIIPSPSPVISPYGMKLLGIFAGLVYGWSFIGLLGTSFIGIFALALAGLGTTESVFVSLFNNATILMMIIGSLGYAVIAQTNASDWLFGKILGTQFAKKSGVLTVMCIFTVVLIMGAVGMGIIINFVLFPIMNDFCKKCGYTKGDRFSTMFLIGYFVAASISIGVFPFYSWGLMICGSVQSITQFMIPLVPYMGLHVIIFVLFLIVWPILMKLVGCDFSKLEQVDVLAAFNVDADTKLNSAQKIALGGLMIFLCLTLVGSFVKVPIIQMIYGKIGVLGLMLLYWLVMLIVKVDGRPLLNMRKASQDLSWDLCIVMATAVVLSNALTSAESGIGTWLAMLVSPIIANTGQITFVLVLAAILMILTNLANNIAVVFILLNVVAAVFMNGMPMNLTVISIVLAMGSCGVAFFTPASSIIGAILHSGEMIESKGVYVWNWVAVLVVYVIMMAVLVPATMLGIGA